ncbi:MAG: hydroxysqualene dehydroxylase HpnE [Pseudomonadota bacterium]
MSRIHIIGAGLSGLAAATRLSEQGVDVLVYDSASQAGGRCRSFHDKHLERDIDNGNHLIMSGNRAALSYLKTIGAEDPLIGPEFATYPFVDVKSGARWTVRINDGPIPFWVFDKEWRVPETKVLDYVKAGAIAFAGADKTVSDIVDKNSVLFNRFWEPLTLAVLNTTPDRGSAQLLWRVIRETFLLGGQASTPRVARLGLGPSFIDPAVAFVERNGGAVRLKTRLRNAWMEGGRVSSLNFPDETVIVDEGDQVIFALPPTRLKQIMPELNPPTDDASILNIHFRISEPVSGDVLGQSPFIGMVSSDGQWAFVRDDVVSVTTSASDALGTDDLPNDTVVAKIWAEVKTALKLQEEDYEKVRVIREKRATPDQSPEGVRQRLQPETQYKNLFLAGDHIDTGVPATIEGSIRSGNNAAALALNALRSGT